IEGAPAEPRAERAERVAGLDLLLHREVDPRAPHLVAVSLGPEVVLHQVRAEPGEALVDVEGDQLEGDGRPALEGAQEVEEHPGVLAPGDPPGVPGPGSEQLEVADGLPRGGAEPPLEPLDVRHGGFLITPGSRRAAPPVVARRSVRAGRPLAREARPRWTGLNE